MVVLTSLFVSYDVLCVLVQVEPPLFTTDDDVLPNAFGRPADSGTQQGMENEVFTFLDLALHLILYDPDANVIRIMIQIVELYDPMIPLLANDSDNSSTPRIAGKWNCLGSVGSYNFMMPH
ncbi:hypothetical protein SO802_011566 [Lithocarpus litseifolius]|uniref:Uncharacterized protein n=1 Tax=Lithocarpus litseifolius TaxID=425828 RepID=A0AAW2D0C7_9ROSI